MMINEKRSLLLIIAASIFGQLAAITGIFYAINMDAWAVLVVPSAAYIGFRYLEEFIREKVRTT